MDYFEASRTLWARQAESTEAGSHRNKSSSVSAMVSTLVPTFILALALLTLFILLRSKQARIYAPRTYHDVLRDEEKTPKSQKGGMFGWINEFRRLPDDYIMKHQSLDAYLFVRFFKMITVMCFVGCCITWPVLFPVNATGGGGEEQLDLLSFSNVDDPARYWAHAAVAWVYLGFIMFMITRETIFYINLRQAYYLAPRVSSRISSRTVLFTSVPEEYLNEAQLRRTFDRVRHIWLSTDCEELEDLVQERDDTVMKLEKAEIKLIKSANDARLKSKAPPTRSQGFDPHKSGSAAAEWISWKDRPTHRLKFLIGKKVDTVNWSRGHLAELIPRVEKMQWSHRDGREPNTGAAFIEFESLRAAQAAAQVTAHEKPNTMVARATGARPDEIIWKNLGMSAWQRAVRGVVANAFVWAMIIFWSIPVAVVGAISNINNLTDKVPWLEWILDIPDVILGVITGLLPTVLLAILVILVPIICRLCAKMSGSVTLADVELRTQTWYFAFQVIQVFLVTTFTSGAAAVVTQIIDDPTAAPTLLAKNLPKASNFYIAYFILYGVALSAKTIFNGAALVIFNVLGRLLDKSPRKMYNRYIKIAGLGWGSLYPKFANLAVIAVAYSCIAPLVLGFATIGLGFLYVAFRYNVFYAVDTTIDTHGQAYGRALQQLTVGVYLSEICLIGLFAIASGSDPMSSGPLILTIILFVISILYHIKMRRSLHPLTQTLPSSLLAENEAQTERERALEEGESSDADSYAPGRDSTVGLKPGEERTVHLHKHNGHNKLARKDHAHTAAAPEGRQQPGAPPPPAKDLGRDHDGAETAAAAGGSGVPNGGSSKAPPATSDNQMDTGKRGGILQRFLNPAKYASYHTLRSSLWATALAHPVPPYSADVRRDAFLHPAVSSPPPVIWLVRDEMGVSAQECRHNEEVRGLRCTDEGAVFDEKGKVRWVGGVREAPMWRREELRRMI
ncbi:putative DUF221 domain protein [Lineolata rhizophorae]|uniref:Putative DUF221 domain protein n=1 Tax=Lineolata rhizophorae TaxID=578093 RepID=A0A6A6NLL0_9PEZI|nr:putative DUF221 domain protein [Lineolata rhizophorae]